MSINGSKILTTSGGGMLLSDDEELMRTARYRSTQPREFAAWYEHWEVGYNYGLSDVLAALGRAHLTRLDAMFERRRTLKERYAAALADLPLRLWGRDGCGGDVEDNHWLTTVAVEDPTVDIPGLIARVNAEGVGVLRRHLVAEMACSRQRAGRP